MDVLLDKSPLWLTGEGPEADLVVACRGRLSRDFTDFPFPAAGSDEEKAAVEERVCSALDSANLLAEGNYCSLQGLDMREARLFAERGLISSELLDGTGPRGVYVTDDQCLSIMVNGADHVCMQVLVSGLHAQEAWTRLNLTDDTLAEALDFAFDDKLGYLTSKLDNLGTALTLTVVLHLPALTMMGKVGVLDQLATEKGHQFYALYGSLSDAKGDLYQLTNKATLGCSEEEIAFHLKHLAMDIVAQERSAREEMLSENPINVKDRVKRALGVARGAHLLDFDEALSIISSIRFGITAGLIEGYGLPQLNELLISAQYAHLEKKLAQKGAAGGNGGESGGSGNSIELAVNGRRAEVFRTCFS